MKIKISTFLVTTGLLLLSALFSYASEKITLNNTKEK
jgi:hypothetical protein